jgi:hypothetical protein
VRISITILWLFDAMPQGGVDDWRASYREVCEPAEYREAEPCQRGTNPLRQSCHLLNQPQETSPSNERFSTAQ